MRNVDSPFDGRATTRLNATAADNHPPLIHSVANRDRPGDNDRHLVCPSGRRTGRARTRATKTNGLRARVVLIYRLFFRGERDAARFPAARHNRATTVVAPRRTRERYGGRGEESALDIEI